MSRAKLPSKFPKPTMFGEWELAYYSEQLQLTLNTGHHLVIVCEPENRSIPHMRVDIDQEHIDIPISAVKAWIAEYERWNGSVD